MTDARPTPWQSLWRDQAVRLGKAVLRRTRGRLVRERGELSRVAAGSTGDITYPVRPPLPLPNGLTDDDLRRIMRSFSIDGSPPGALEGYVADSFERFAYTFGLTEGLEGPALELGSNPYFMSYLLLRHTELVPVFANYFGDAVRGNCLSQTLSYEDRDGLHTLEMPSHRFNLEEDRFPFPEGAFKVVMFCEIIEHLLVDPTHPLREINRVLTSEGHLILTTPNMARLENVLRIVAGEGTGDPYSANGPYGRHNREYTLHELSRLLEFCGFEMEVAFTADSPRSDHSHRYAFVEMAPLLRRREKDLGHYIFIRARKVSEPRAGLPSFLFAAYPSERIVPVEL